MIDLKGRTIVTQVNYIVSIVDLSDNLPEICKEDFIDWLRSQVIENGLGNHTESYYDSDDSGENSIIVKFKVNLL